MSTLESPAVTCSHAGKNLVSLKCFAMSPLVLHPDPAAVVVLPSDGQSCKGRSEARQRKHTRRIDVFTARSCCRKPSMHLLITKESGAARHVSRRPGLWQALGLHLHMACPGESFLKDGCTWQPKNLENCMSCDCAITRKQTWRAHGPEYSCMTGQNGPLPNCRALSQNRTSTQIGLCKAPLHAKTSRVMPFHALGPGADNPDRRARASSGSQAQMPARPARCSLA